MYEQSRPKSQNLIQIVQNVNNVMDNIGLVKTYLLFFFFYRAGRKFSKRKFLRARQGRHVLVLTENRIKGF